MYSQAVLELYTVHGATLIGIKAVSPLRKNYQSQVDEDLPIILNPNGDFEIKAGDVGFAICTGDLSFSHDEDPAARSRHVRNRRQSLVQSMISPDSRPLMGSDDNDQDYGSSVQDPPRRMSRSGSLPRPAARSSLPRQMPMRPLKLDKDSLAPKYVLLREPTKLVDVTLEEVKFSGHIIVCGFKQAMHHFIAPLRLESLRIRPKIVIMAKRVPTDEE